MTLPEALAVVAACTNARFPYSPLYPSEHGPQDGGDRVIPQPVYDAAIDVIRASAQQTARNHANKDFGYG